MQITISWKELLHKKITVCTLYCIIQRIKWLTSWLHYSTSYFKYSGWFLVNLKYLLPKQDLYFINFEIDKKFCPECMRENFFSSPRLPIKYVITNDYFVTSFARSQCHAWKKIIYKRRRKSDRWKEALFCYTNFQT